MRLLLPDAAIGVLLLAVIVVASRQNGRMRSARVRACGWLLIAVPLPLAVCLHLAVRLPLVLDQATFLAGAVAFAVGAVLILGDEETDWRRERDEDTPPWWPAFERELRLYESSERRRRIHA
jgi:hypothetical protein